MSIELVTINGFCNWIDYESFETDLNHYLEGKCQHAKVYLYNNFPVDVSSEDLIDLLIIIAVKDTYQNYFQIQKDSDIIYLKNLIMPVKFFHGFENQSLFIENDELIFDEASIDHASLITSMKFGLEKYLREKCNFSEAYLNVHPLVFLKHDSDFTKLNYLIGADFNFNRLISYLAKILPQSFKSTDKWTKSKIIDQYNKITDDIKIITDQASSDSEAGYLTKKKIDLIGRKISRTSKIQRFLNKSLIIISGKAGTGKSSELHYLIIQTLLRGNNSLYLTYNNLLVFDYQNSFRALKIQRKVENKKFGESSISSLVKFFYDLSKSLGVLHVMSEERIKELDEIYRTRLIELFNFVKSKSDDKYILSEPEKLKESIQLYSRFDVGTKELGIQLVNYSTKQRKNFVDSRDDIFNGFNLAQKKMLHKIALNEIFLGDYYGVLKNILQQIDDPLKYFNENNIKNKGLLLENIYNFSDENYNENNEIIADVFIKKNNRKIGGKRRKRTLFIDEGQDCHYLEKDILIKIFGSENIVVANGGIEQLIRHKELCNWNYSQGRDLKPVLFNTRKKSYRMKKNLLQFSMFIAEKYGIKLELEPYEEKSRSTDLGKVIVYFSDTFETKVFTSELIKMNESAKIHGCNKLESLLILIENLGFNKNEKKSSAYTSSDYIIVDEHENLSSKKYYKRRSLDLPSIDNEDGIKFDYWDGTIKDKRENGPPTSNQTRVIFYESCRGLEAWNVMCLSADLHFAKKYNDEDSEKFLLTNESQVLTTDMFLSNDDRKKLYAATSILMATTRAIDTLFIHIEDRESEFGTIVQEYIDKFDHSIEVLSD